MVGTVKFDRATLLKTVRHLAPLSAFFCITVICLAAKEWFPFSHFPMYSGFDKADYYVYVTDQAGQPIPVESLTYLRSGRLKKIFNHELRKIHKKLKKKKLSVTPEECVPAGISALDWLYANATHNSLDPQEELRRKSPLRIYQVLIEVKGGKVTETPRFITEHSPGEKN